MARRTDDRPRTRSARAVCWSIFIVDDHAIVRTGLRQLFEQEQDFRVCGEASTAAEAFAAITRETTDLVTADLVLPGRSGLELIKQLNAERPALPILAVSMHEPALYADRALAAGARGYVSKGCSNDEIMSAARAVLAGKTYICRGDGCTDRGRPEASPLTERLTDRELEVLLLLGQGFAPRHIAHRLSLSTSTVEVYRQRMKRKLRLDNSTALLRFAIEWYHDRHRPPVPADPSRT